MKLPFWDHFFRAVRRKTKLVIFIPPRTFNLKINSCFKYNQELLFNTNQQSNKIYILFISGLRSTVIETFDRGSVYMESVKDEEVITEQKQAIIEQ